MIYNKSLHLLMLQINLVFLTIWKVQVSLTSPWICLLLIQKSPAPRAQIFLMSSKTTQPAKMNRNNRHRLLCVNILPILQPLPFTHKTVPPLTRSCGPQTRCDLLSGPQQPAAGWGSVRPFCLKCQCPVFRVVGWQWWLTNVHVTPAVIICVIFAGSCRIESTC